MTSDEFKAKGNVFFKEKEYFKAAGMYSKAIKANPDAHALYSNRSASFMKMDPPKDVKALADANKCIQLKPDWAKGYYRKAQALKSLGRFEEAIEACTQCVDVDEGMKKEGAQFTKEIKLLKQTKVKEEVERLLSREQYKEFKLKPGQLLIQDTPERRASFFTQMKTAVTLAAQNGGTTLNTINASMVLLQGKMDSKSLGAPPKLVAQQLPQALLSEQKQAELAKKLAPELRSDNMPTHAMAFICEKSKLLAPRKWESRPDSAPAKGDGVFLQLESSMDRTILFLPTEKSKSKDAQNTVGEYVELSGEFNILPSILFG